MEHIVSLASSNWLGGFFTGADYDLLIKYMPRILWALVLGLFLGVERRSRGKVSGVRTHMIIAVSACIATVSGLYMFDVTKNGDPLRLAHGIITGVGFVGAGVIIKRGLNATGLTTSATILLSVAIGVGCAIGLHVLALATTVVVWLSVWLTYKIFPSRDYGGNIVRVVCPKAKWNDLRHLFGPAAHIDRVRRSGVNIEVNVHTNLGHDEVEKLIASQVFNDDIIEIEFIDAPLD
jgi:Uncharacterized membrane protein